MLRITHRCIGSYQQIRKILSKETQLRKANCDLGHSLGHSLNRSVFIVSTAVQAIKKLSSKPVHNFSSYHNCNPPDCTSYFILRNTRQIDAALIALLHCRFFCSVKYRIVNGDNDTSPRKNRLAILHRSQMKQAVRAAATICPRPQQVVTNKHPIFAHQFSASYPSPTLY